MAARQAPAGIQLHTLEALTSARNYRQWLCDLARPYLGDDPLEIGSGLGDYAQTWLDGGVPRLTVSEVDDELLGRLRTRFAGDERVQVSGLDLGNATASPSAGARTGFSSVVALNVLEHIADDVAALRAARRLVARSGAVTVLVPAVPAAMSRFDRQIGHFRRYSRPSLSRTLQAAGLEIERIDYVNAAGLVAWFVGMRLLGLAPREGSVLTAWDRLVVPISRAVEGRVGPPIGQSLFAVGRPSSRA